MIDPRSWRPGPAARRTRNLMLLAVALGLTVAAGIAHADPMVGQPKPTPELSRQVSRAMSDFLRGGASRSGGRSTLLEILDQNPTVDLTDALGQALADQQTYSAVASTYLDAIEGTKAQRDRAYIRYNLAKVYALRAGLVAPGQNRNALVNAADHQLRVVEYDAYHDPGVAELRGDVALLGDDLANAIGGYTKIPAYGGSKVTAHRKIGQAYMSRRNYSMAARYLKSAADAAAAQVPTGDPMQVFNLYQDVAAVAYQAGDYRAAADSLRRAGTALANVQATDITLRLDLARVLLRYGGNTRDIRAYLEAAVRVQPDNGQAKELLSTARNMP